MRCWRCAPDPGDHHPAPRKRRGPRRRRPDASALLDHADRHELLINTDVGFCRSSMTRKRTLNGVPRERPRDSSSKCAAPAPAGACCSVTSGPALGTEADHGPVHAGSPTLRSGARCTMYVALGNAPWMRTSPCTWKVPWSAVGAAVHRAGPRTEQRDQVNPVRPSYHRIEEAAAELAPRGATESAEQAATIGATAEQAFGEMHIPLLHARVGCDDLGQR